MRSIEEIEKQISEKDVRGSFKEIFSLHLILRSCVFTDDKFKYDFDIKPYLSDLGEIRYNELKNSLKNSNNTLLSLVMLRELYHEDFYVDLEKLRVDDFFKFVSEAIQNGKIHLIWWYGRHLYDRYFDEFEDQSEELDYEETIKLLKGTYKGVYQLDRIITGPFGLLRSSVDRLIQPKLEIHLWHCPDPSCENFHITELHNNAENEIFTASSTLWEIQEGKDDVDILSMYMKEVDQDRIYYDQYSLDGLHELLGNCFGREELSTLLDRLMRIKELRSYLPNTLQKGNPTEIVKKLNKAECLQLILIASDRTILTEIEKLINEKVIEIPSTEIRESELNFFYGHFDTYLECNQLGIRVSSNRAELSGLKLKKLLKGVHSDSPLREQLEWKLKKYSGETTIDQKLEKYLTSEDPKKIVSETLLIGPSQLNKTFELLPGYFETPIDTLQEEMAVNKILWKLGFDINLYPDHLTKFWRHLDSFKSQILSSRNYNDEDKENIRSAAVNFFVLLEEILERSLSFLTWTLLSDHYFDTKFKYVFEEARDFMVSQLNGHEFTEGETLILDSSGKNTLFPLIQGFSSLVNICDELIDSGNHKRPKSEFPSFYLKDPLKVFPFEHKKFLLDLNPRDYENLKSVLGQISKEFTTGDVLNIRNRLQHKRDSFPTSEEIQDAINSVDRCISQIENYGIYPNVFLRHQSIRDRFNRLEVTFTNYKGKQLNIYPSPEFVGSHLPSLDNPIIIFENIKLGLTNQPIRFQYMEKSKYQTYWKNYPRKKR